MVNKQGLGECGLAPSLNRRYQWVQALSLIRMSQPLLVEIVCPEKKESRTKPLRGDS